MQSYDVNKPSKFIVYFDKNNAYSWAMHQYLPCNRFRWLSQKEIDKSDVNLIKCNFIEENSSDRSILEVDLEYPDELHDFHNDYPLASEKLEISHNMLSSY